MPSCTTRTAQTGCCTSPAVSRVMALTFAKLSCASFGDLATYSSTPLVPGFVDTAFLREQLHDSEFAIPEVMGPADQNGGFGAYCGQSVNYRKWCNLADFNEVFRLEFRPGQDDRFPRSPSSNRPVTLYSAPKRHRPFPRPQAWESSSSLLRLLDGKAQ